MAKPKLKVKSRTWNDGFKKRSRIDLSKDINLMAQIVVKETKDGINGNKDVDGKRFKKLKPETVKQKIKKSYPRTPLKATGRMSDVYMSNRASKKSQKATVSMPGGRNDVGYYHNTGQGNLPKREWFGIGKKIEKKFEKYIKSRIKNILRIK